MIVSALTACSKPTADTHIERADDYMKQSQVQEAIIEYRNAIQIAPTRGDARLKLADAYMQVRSPSEALREYVRAADLLPNDIDAQIKAGSILLLAGAFEDAQSRAKIAIALDGSNVDAMILLANSKAGLKNLEGALTEYQEAATLNPSERVYAGMGTIQLARGDTAGAEASFRKAVELAPKSVSARLALASFFWSSQRPQDAEAELKAALALESTNVLANRALGMFYLASGRAGEAEPYFKAIAEEVKTTETAIALADYYLMTSRIEESRAVLRTLLSDEKAWAQAMTRLAAVDAMEGLRSKAAERTAEVLAKYPDDRPARLLLARVHMADGKPEDALKEASLIVQHEPNAQVAGDAYMIIGQVHAALDRPEAAIKAYEEVLARQRQPFVAALALASLHLSRGAIDKATTYVQQAITIQPTHPLARAMKVRVLLIQGKTNEARAELTSLQKEFPNALPVLNLQAAQQMVEGQTAAARASYARAAALAPDALEPLTALVQLDVQAGRVEDAITRVEAVLKVNNRSSDLYILAARTYASARQFERAEEMLTKAVELDPARLRGYGMLAQLYVVQNRLPDAERQYKVMVEKNPDSVAINTMLGMLYDMRGKFDDAEAQYQKVLSIDPEAAVAANNLAFRWADTNRNLDQALQLAQTAQRKLPGEPNVSDTLGWTLYRKGMTTAAIRQLESAVQARDKDPLLRYHLGMSYHQAGQVEKARTMLRAALELSKTFPGADEAQKTLASLGG